MPRPRQSAAGYVGSKLPSEHAQVLLRDDDRLLDHQKFSIRCGARRRLMPCPQTLTAVPGGTPRTVKGVFARQIQGGMFCVSCRGHTDLPGAIPPSAFEFELIGNGFGNDW